MPTSSRQDSSNYVPKKMMLIVLLVLSVVFFGREGEAAARRVWMCGAGSATPRLENAAS